MLSKLRNDKLKSSIVGSDTSKAEALNVSPHGAATPRPTFTRFNAPSFQKNTAGAEQHTILRSTPVT
jgi:hypothetical protein